MKLKTEYYQIRSSKIPDVFHGYRIVFLTDLHNCQIGNENHVLYHRICALKPDLILVGGDMVVGRRDFKDFSMLRHFFHCLGKHFPVIYSYGNHERRLSLYAETAHTSFPDYISMLKKSGIDVLNNESIMIEKEGRRICVSGLNMDLDYYGKFYKKSARMPKDYVKSVLGEPKGEYRILMAHHPKHFERYAQWGADLVLSGHVHGGIMRLPLLGGVISPTLLLFPKYDGGLFKKGSSAMILSRGLGTHTLPIRIFNPGELILFTISPKRNLAKNKEN